jgi:hypothetical protein
LWELSFGIVRDAYWSTFWKKRKTTNAARYVQTLNKLRRALRGKCPKKKTCHPSTWQCDASHCTSDLADNSKERLGPALPFTLQSKFGPLRLPLVRALESTWGVTTTRLTTQSRKPCVAGCEELERTSTATLTEMHRSVWRFHRKVIRDA